MDISEVRKAHKVLQKAFQEGNQMLIIDILRLLKNKVVVSEALVDTKVGVTIGKLRNYSEKYVADLAKEISKKWKGDFSALKKASLVKNTSEMGKMSATTSTSNTSEKTRNMGSKCIKNDITGDKVRDNCISLIYTALVSDSEDLKEEIFSKAKAIDEFVFASCSHKTDDTYRQKMRSLLLNLKDKNNPGLRENVVNGELSIPRLCTMTPQEMASKERKEEIKKLEEMNLFKARGPKPIKAVTDLFQCGKCKQRKVSYYQMQTRRADEPMTTFYECQVCDNRWKT
ncbi:transcription elongation factor S-II [Pneumocystis carinii B80]|uniref:Transcription elongation factor n=1 Tax=Pneumocystis carinii (strain B80) TaxID=1408658 RepID=A0A0W4ZQQ1_PNEC8|nr:transcription elongation factor S-II [Pneumocystis carinii B80]KTW30703.1 transcription elongation factor S-II [Pneumocystis carinii B80]